MQRALRRLSSMVHVTKVPSVITAKWEPTEQWIPVWQRMQRVELSDRTVKLDFEGLPEIHAVAATSVGSIMESQLSALKNIWAHLKLTYGLKDECLQRFLSFHIKETAAHLPQCKLVSVRRLFEGEADGGPYINEEFVRFAAERGSVLDPAREPDEYPELHQLLVDFGRSICEEYPIIFRDLYLLNARNNTPLVVELNERLKFIPRWPREKDDAEQTLTNYLKNQKNVERWYCYASEYYNQLGETTFRFIRSLSDNPFDPIAQSDEIDPEVQLKAWEHAGLLAAAPVKRQLNVEDGAVPSPIIDQLKPGSLVCE